MKPTKKTLALAAIDRARDEAIRPDCSLTALAALLGDARSAVEGIEELRRARPTKKPRVEVH